MGRKRAVSLLVVGALLAFVAYKLGVAKGTMEENNLSEQEMSVAFSTYVGGSRQDSIRGIAVDGEGNVYITGGTESSNFPVTAGAYDTSFNGWHDVFVMKVSPEGKVIWSTFIGGPGYDRAYAIEVDAKGYIYVAGRAGPGFPVTGGAFQTRFMGGQESPRYGPQDGFVLKLTPDGSKLVWASYFGTSDPGTIRDLDIDRDGNVYIVSGHDPTQASAMPPGWSEWFAKGFQKFPQGGTDRVVAKIAPDGSRVLWATFLGGSADEGGGPTIRVDSRGYPYVFTNTMSADMPTTPRAYDTTHNGGTDVYVAKLTPDGSALVYGTYLGGSRDDGPGDTHGGAVDAEGNAYVSGYTFSHDFPTTSGVLRRMGGNSNKIADSFTSKLSPDGSHLIRSTYYGAGEGVAVDSSGNVYFTGGSIRPDYPITTYAFQKKLKGIEDAIVAKLSADFSKFLYATYMGGTTERRYNEGFRAIAIDSKGNIYAAGVTASKDWPILNAFQASHAGDWDGVLVKFAFRK